MKSRNKKLKRKIKIRKIPIPMTRNKHKLHFQRRILIQIVPMMPMKTRLNRQKLIAILKPQKNYQTLKNPKPMTALRKNLHLKK